MARKPERLPATVTPEAKQDLLKRLDRRIAGRARHYAYQMKHGGTAEEKARTKTELQMLENEKKTVQRMEPYHVRRAERSP